MAETRQRWNDLRLRVLSALVLAPIALTFVWIGGIAFDLLIAAATIGMAFEWWQMLRSERSSSSHIAWLLVGLLYILLAAAALLWIRDDPVIGRVNTLFLLILVWSSDIGAYLAGRIFGGPRLAPRISPGKTVSGAVGGLVAVIAVGIAAALATSVPTPPGRGALVGAMLGVVAQTGDLLESWIKRRFGVKDSGRLIPGHGGLLDRLDALLAVAIGGGLLALMAGPGVVLWE